MILLLIICAVIAALWAAAALTDTVRIARRRAPAAVRRITAWDTVREAFYRLERRIFFATGARLPMLRARWRREGRRLQRQLDREHRTNTALCGC